MTCTPSVVHIPAEAVELSGRLCLPPSADRLVLAVHAGASDSSGAHDDLLAIESVLLSHNVAVLTTNLLTPAEETDDRRSGRYHLDVPFLGNRVCLALAWIGRQPTLESLPVAVLAKGMAAAGAVVSASHHPEVRAIVSVSGRTDLAEGALEQLGPPTLLIARADEPHLVDLNRQAAHHLRAQHRLDVLPCTVDSGASVIAGRAVDWIEAHLSHQ